MPRTEERHGTALVKQARRCLMEGHTWGAITALDRMGPDADAADYEAVLALGPQLQAMASNPQQQAACEDVIRRARSALEVLAPIGARPSDAPAAVSSPISASPPVREEDRSAAASARHATAPAALAYTKLCPRCAEEVKGAALVCRFCGFRFAQAAPGPLPAGHEPPTTSWVAVAAFLLSLSSLWPAAIPLAVHGRRMIDASGGRLVGRGFATAALVIGILALVCWILFAAGVVLYVTHFHSLP